MVSLRQLLAATLTAASAVQASPQHISHAANSSSSSSRACNNSPTLCSRSYGEITYMGAHDAAFLRNQSQAAGTSLIDVQTLAGNQFRNATDALDAGLRMLQAQVHKQNSSLHLCHTSCDLLDAGPLETWLSAIDFWMGKNPNDVITLLLVNSDNADVSEFASAFQSSGLSRFGFTPSGKGWPTLDSMISNGTRMVSFITNIKATSSAAYLLPEFNYVFETAFGVSNDNGFNCTLDRPSGVGDASSAVSKGLLGLINHFEDIVISGNVEIPDVGAINTTNSDGNSTVSMLGRHVQLCDTQWGQRPSFVLVDFWDQGQTVQAADNINGISDATGRNASPPSDNAQSSSGSAKTHNLGRGALLAFVVAALWML